MESELFPEGNAICIKDVLQLITATTFVNFSYFGAINEGALDSGEEGVTFNFRNGGENGILQNSWKVAV